MKNKYNIITEKLLLYIPLLMFLLYTNIHFLFAMRSNSKIISMLIKAFNMLYMIGPYIFFVVSLILAIYILINGSKKHKLIMMATGIGCFLMHYNLLSTESTKTVVLTELLFISSYLMGIFYTLSLFIYLKDKKTADITKKIITGAKSIVIYIGVIFVLAILSNTSQYSYVSAEQGLTAWFRSTNGLGHALVFLLPLFILFYLRDKKNKYLFYIVVISILDLLIGTKACYYGLLSTLSITILYLLVDIVKNKKNHYFKLLSLVIILILSILISSDLYVIKNIEKSIDHSINEKGQVDVVNFVISNRDDNASTIKTFFRDSNIFTKMFGLGLYYPKFDFIYVELDLLDLLYSRGIYGLILYVTFFGFIIINIFIEVFKKIKKGFDIDILLMLLTLGYIGFASLFVGHVLFNLMPLTVAIMVMLYYVFTINKEQKNKKILK